MSETPNIRPLFVIPAWRVDDVLFSIASGNLDVDDISVRDAIRKTTEYLIGHHIDPLTGVGKELPFSVYMKGSPR